MKAIISIEGKTYDEFPKLVRNDKGWKIVFTLKYNDDSVVDLSTGVVLFKVKGFGSTGLKINGTCTLDAPTTGVCSYTILTADLNASGKYDSELEVTLSAKVYTIKLGIIQIIDDLV